MNPEEAYNILYKSINNHPNKANLEEIIANDAVYSYFYALRVLKSRFLLGEKAIMGNPYYSKFYEQDFRVLFI